MLKKRIKDKFFIVLIAAVYSLRALCSLGQTIPTEKMVSVKPATFTESLYHQRRWEFSLESAYLFKVIPNPWFMLLGQRSKNPLHYRLATQILSAHYQATDLMGPSLLHGTLMVSGGLIYSAIIEGPETYFVGLALGLRYYFVQAGAKIVPYLEIRGGPGLTDAGRIKHAQQQDFTFTYMLGAGLRYDFGPRVSLSIGLLDEHLSNAYQTHPNYGFDALGINLGLIVPIDSFSTLTQTSGS